MSDQGQDASSGRHTFELRTAQGARSLAGGGGGGTGIYYHAGGTVLGSGVNVVAVYWASGTIYKGGPTPGTTGTGGQDGSLIGYLLSNLGTSTHYAINGTYTDGTGKAINPAVKYTGFWANNGTVPANGQNVTDANMVAMLQWGFNSGALTYDANTLYAIFTNGTVNLGGGAGSQYCAYHTHANVSINGVTKNIYYAAMPFNYAWPSGCTAGKSPNGDPAADAEVNTLTHEIEETHTDALGNAWFDRRGYENADKCAWTFAAPTAHPDWNVTIGAKNFLIQQNWINTGTGGCRTTI